MPPEMDYPSKRAAKSSVDVVLPSTHRAHMVVLCGLAESTTRAFLSSMARLCFSLGFYGKKTSSCGKLKMGFFKLAKGKNLCHLKKISNSVNND
jgi:hypothetical protein